MSGFDRYEQTPQDDRQQLIQEMEEINKCPASWANGPVRNPYRRVTDRCCLAIFLLVLALMIGTTIYIFCNSNKNYLKNVYDSSGNICGQGNAQDFPYLYLQTFSEPFKSVCVKSCPSFDYNQIKYNPTGANINTDYPPMTFFEFTKLTGVTMVKDLNFSRADTFAYDSTWANGYFTQKDFETYVNKIKIQCLTNKQYLNCNHNDPKSDFYIYDSYTVLNKFCAPASPKPALLFNELNAKIYNGDFGDVIKALPIFGWCALVAFGLSLIYLILLTCCTRPITWLLMVSISILLIAFGSLLLFYSYKYGNINESFNPDNYKVLKFFAKNKTISIISGVAFLLSGLFVFFIICKYRKEIGIAIPLVSIATKSSLQNLLLLFLSLFVMIVQVGIIIFEIYVCLRIYSMGDENRDSQNGYPLALYNTNIKTILLYILHCFGTYWLIIVLNNFNDFVCASVSVNYYWTANIENIRIFCHSLGHNIGTLAWTIIFLPIFVLKIAFGWLDWLTSSNNPNALQRGVRKILCPCCFLYENLVDVVSENSLAIVYMGSTDFWPSNKRYYYLSEKYYDESSTISIVGMIYQIIGKLSITVITMFIGFSIFNSNIKYYGSIDNVGLILGFIGFVGFFIGSLFINIFVTTFESMLACFLIEMNIQQFHSREVINCPGELKEVMDELRREQNKNYSKLN